MNAKINDGGPAFPQHGWSSDPNVVERMNGRQGMSLRAYLAGQALAGIMARNHGDGSLTLEDLAEDAVAVADLTIWALGRKSSDKEVA